MENAGSAESSAHYTATQKKVFTNWANIKLKGSGQAIVELTADLCDGVRLIKLLEILARRAIGKKYRENYPTMKFMRLDNMTAAFDFLKREAVRLENIGPEDIVDGNIKLILGLIWTLIRRYDIDSITFEGDDGAGGVNPLLTWVQKRTKGYPKCNVTNLDTSFQDGMAFNALLHSYYPDGIDYQDMDPQNARDNLNHAFDAAEKYWGIPKMIDAEDFLGHKPDDKAVQTYLAAMYQGLQKPPQVPEEELAAYRAQQAEAQRQKELAAQAERDRLAELARMQQEAEALEKAHQEELARQQREADEAERKRKEELARQKREADEELARQKREAEEAERLRKAEQDRLAALEADRLRQEELERQRLEEAERQRKEAERKRQEEEEAERLRLAELERQRLEAERLAQEEEERQERLAREKEQMEKRGDLAIGEWAGEEAGGSPDHASFRNNPMFELSVTEDTPLLVTLKSDAPDAHNTRMGFYVVRPTDPTGITLPLDSSAIVAKADPVRGNEVSVEMYLSPSAEPYILIPYTDNPNENGHFSLKAVPTQVNEAVVKLQPQGLPEPYKMKAAIPGEWTEAMSGGMYDLPTWRENPQFMVKCFRPTKLKIFLTQPYDAATGTSLNSISFNLVRNIDDNETEYVLVANDVLKQVSRLLSNGKVVHYSNDKAEVSMDYDVDFGEGPYPPLFVVPSCWSANTVGKFMVTVYSDQEDTEVRFVGGLTNFPHKIVIAGEWKGDNAGGNRTCETWRNNPQYKISCSCPTKMSLVLARTKNEIVTEDGISFLANKQIGISFHVVRNKDPNFTDNVLPSCEILGTPKQYEQRAEVAINITLDSRPAFIVPSTYNPASELDFNIVCYSEFPVTIAPVTESSGSNITLNSEWKGKSTGGSSNKPTWRDNPNFRLTVPNNNTLVSIILKQDIAAGAKPKGVAVHLVKNKDNRFRSKLLPTFDNVAETRNGDYVYMARPEVSIETKLNQGTYFIVPSTFNGGAAEEGKFTLSIVSNQKTTCEDARAATLAYESSIRGEWKGTTAGGNANEATWKNNPRVRLTVANKGLVAVAIAQDTPAGAQPKGIGFQIMNDQGTTLVHRFMYEGNYAYVPKPEISSEMSLEKGSYVIIPSTFNKGEEAKFTVSAMSEDTSIQVANISGAISQPTNITPSSSAPRPAPVADLPAASTSSPTPASPSPVTPSSPARSPAPSSPASAGSPARKKITLEDLETLASLRDKGIISEAEFQAKKREALGL